mmetsp:Transcript_42972/g.110997  ORF Transcript_42972/g.110997 Transcript_42972/m.110997 type:complete len:83 (+) Transcript_42972:41-289(+)
MGEKSRKESGSMLNDNFSFLIPVKRRRPSQVEALLSSLQKKDKIGAGQVEVTGLEGHRVALDEKRKGREVWVRRAERSLDRC